MINGYLKKDKQQEKDYSLGIYLNNKFLTPVHDFDCPVPLYSDEDGQLYTAFYYLDTSNTVVIPFFDSIESMDD